MGHKSFLKTVGFVIVISAVVPFITSCEPGANGFCEEKHVAFIELPRVVRKTLRRQLLTLTTIDTEKIEFVTKKGGRKIYNITLLAGNIKYKSEVAEDGTLIKKEIVWLFDRDESKSVPKGWGVSETNSKGKPATWQVIGDDSAPSKPNIVAITSNENSGHTYNLLIAEHTNFKNVNVMVMVKAISGMQDQGGGVIWRAQDSDNYYIARWNPLENNFRVYFVKDGNRKQLASAYMKLDPQKWHRLNIKHIGKKIIARVDEKKYIEVEDTTFSCAGKVGLWTKADAATGFGGFKVKMQGQNK
ncbi:MAG: hypothetical protein KAS75_07010 [Planctomycetes bacterium]|nr:hypothetical protein [Planctomycetota bacterium]